MADSNGIGKYDWVKITKDFLKSNFKSVRAFAEWCEVQRKEGKDMPCSSLIARASKKYAWNKLKRQKELRMLERLVDGRASEIDPELAQQLKESVTMKNNLTKALVDLVLKFSENPERIHMKANLSDVVNDAKRALNMKTKEDDLRQSPSIHVNQGVIGLDSRRRELEEASDSDIKKLKDKSESVNKMLKNKFNQIEIENVKIVDIEDIPEGEEKENG